MSELSALAEPVPPAGKVSAAPLPSAVARRRRRRLQVQVLRIALALALVGGWELGTRAGVIDPFFWGKPSGIANQIWIWITQGTAQGPLWEQIATTMEETILGFLIGVVLGVVFGILLGRNRLLADILSPYIKAANSIPRVVLGSIFVIAFGLGMQSKVALAVVLVFFIVFFNAFQGVREVDKNLLANARILGADGRRLTTEVIIPSALSWIMASLHVSFGFALVGAVVGEYLGAIKGVGLMIVVAQNTFNANGVFAAIVILATVALVAEAIVTAIENRLVKWRPNAVTEVTI
jgi:NitT/TauT family transport system permease protein